MAVAQLPPPIIAMEVSSSSPFDGGVDSDFLLENKDKLILNEIRPIPAPGGARVGHDLRLFYFKLFDPNSDICYRRLFNFELKLLDHFANLLLYFLRVGALEVIDKVVTHFV